MYLVAAAVPVNMAEAVNKVSDKSFIYVLIIIMGISSIFLKELSKELYFTGICRCILYELFVMNKTHFSITRPRNVTAKQQYI